MFKVLYLFLIIKVSNCLEAYNDQFRNSSETVICRNCGSDILSTDSIISKLSPVSLYSFNDTVFNEDKILVQVLSKDLILQFPIITAKTSICQGVGEWQDDDYWFPNYHWKPCICSQCGAFIGWIYEPMHPFSMVILDPFFGLIPAHLVGKSFADSLIIYAEEIINKDGK